MKLLYILKESLFESVSSVNKEVSDMFEKDPSLANQVFDTLGFNKLRKEYSPLIINLVWKRLAKKGISNADSLIGTRDTINEKDFIKFWSNVKNEDIEGLIDFFKSEKQKSLDSYNKHKGEFDSSTGAFTSNDTSFFDKKINDLQTLLKQNQQAIELYSKYIEKTGSKDLEGFLDFIKNKK
jgi:hypothetical protein